MGTDDDGRRTVDVAVLRHGQQPVREVVAQLYQVGLVPAFGWPNATLAFERTLAKRPGEYTRDDTWSITFTVPDACEFWAWGLYRWSGTPGACCSYMDTPIALELPGLPSSKSLPLSRSEAAPKANKKHSFQLSNADLYPGDLYCLYAKVRLPGSETQVERRRVVGRGDGESLAPALDDLGEVVTGPVRLHARCAGQSRYRVVDAYDSLGGTGGELDIRSGRWMKDVAWSSPPDADAPILATYTAVVATYGDPVTYPIASAVFGSPCFTGGRVLTAYEVEDGYEYDVQTAARAESGHSLGIVRVRPSDNRRYAIGEWVTIHIDSAQCRNIRPGVDFAWVVADAGTTGGAKPSIVPVSVDGYPRLGTPGQGGSVDYGTRGQDALQRARIYTGMIVEIHRDRDPVTADVYLAAFGRVNGVRFFYHCEADNDRNQTDPEFMADAHSAFDADDIVRVLHVGGRRFETEAVTGDDLRVIGFADGKARPCVKQFLLFYKSGGTAKMASFGFTDGRLSVLRHGDAEKQGFSGITDHLVTYEKELRPDSAESTSILMGVPFEIADDEWTYTGFDPVYTDPYYYAYKYHDAELSTREMRYGVMTGGGYLSLSAGGNPFCGTGFSYTGGDVLFFDKERSVYTSGILYDVVTSYILDIVELEVVGTAQGTLSSPVLFVTPENIALCTSQTGGYGAYPPGLIMEPVSSYSALLPSEHVGMGWIPAYTPRYKLPGRFVPGTTPIGTTYCDAMVSWRLENSPGHLVSIDGRRTRVLSSAEIGSNSGGCTYKRIQNWYLWDMINRSGVSETIASVSLDVGYGGELKFPAYIYEDQNTLQLGYFRTVVDRNITGGGSDPLYSHMEITVSVNGDEVASGYLDFFDPLVQGGNSTSDGVEPQVFPMQFPFGVNEGEVFFLKTINKFSYKEENSVLYSGTMRAAPADISKSLGTPFGDYVLSATSRPMGWTQIQTEDNAHVLQGVLIVNDETSEVMDAMLWHNGDRIEASLAAALGCEVTDLLGVLYLPQASMGGGGDPSLLPDEINSNGPDGFQEFCEAYPGHPSCTYNGCKTVDYADDLRTTLQRINDEVNAAHAYQSDAALYNKLEHWTVLGDGQSGDCEDFALTKVGALIASGIPAGAIKLVVGKAGNGEGHAWVEVQTTNGNYALDINYTSVKPTSSLPYTDVQRQYDGVWWL
ncbi:transglutaminase-like cysteine peptidase [Desulfovibrio sulfodismutans]|uniref:Transglutaminase-like cysteine peptidase n=2 Tax=Desulfolutivibrio sulfodismutans TaxID=63561 RepID=A0A7K3NKJ9_9BACT|nr:transglutaminase-like cysteine peptidase [Desulfolutivibrio sulfodismutans]